MIARDMIRRLHDRGYAIFEPLIDEPCLEELRGEADRLSARSRTRGGVRNLLGRSEVFTRIAETGPLRDLACQLLGPEARARKLTLFNKKPGANWKIRWHQDVAITVRRRVDLDGWSAWSEKEGVLHVRPPARVLEGVVALRLHVDETPSENGALRVIPGSHLEGRLSRPEIQRWRERRAAVICEVAAGGVMAMRPLLLHASSAAASPANRRVLHFEYTAQELPGGLEWA